MQRQTNKANHRFLQLLNGYALAAGAAGMGTIACATANAEVVYTPVQVALPSNTSYAIDFDGDGVTDFTIANRALKSFRFALLSVQGPPFG